MYLDLVARTGLFKNMRPRVIREIVMQLQDLLFLPGDWICRYGDYGDSMYFVVAGNCTIIAKDAKTTLKELGRGSYFGEVALLTGVTRTAYVLARTFCIVAHLTKDGFEPIMRKWPEEIDTLLGGMENAQDRAKIKEEANKYYGLNGHRRRSRRESRDGTFLRRRSCAEPVLPTMSNLSRRPSMPVTAGSFADRSTNSAMFRKRSLSVTDNRMKGIRKSFSLMDEATVGKENRVSNGSVGMGMRRSVSLIQEDPRENRVSIIKPAAFVLDDSEHRKQAALPIQAAPFAVPGSIVDTESTQSIEPETNFASEGSADDMMMQIKSITAQISHIDGAVAGLNSEVHSQKESLKVSLEELKRTVFETMREVVTHEVGVAYTSFNGRADTPSDGGVDNGLEAMVI